MINGNRKRINGIVLLIALPLLVACKKYESCDNATVCVKNTGSDSIPYAWNSNTFVDTLKPGETTCQDVGEFNGDPNNEIGSIVYFETNSATWAIKTTECNTLREIKH